jgi:hypothetical protein
MVINRNVKLKYIEIVSNASVNADSSRLELKGREGGRKLLQTEATYREVIVNKTRYE